MDVADIFAGRSIFITGATGFMGKVLVEKLLRSCPDIKKIYALVRPGRNGESGKQKLDKIHDLPLFNLLKLKHPGALENKLLAIEGNISKDAMGMSIADRQMLINEVSIVYHMAANVRFDQSLKEAILMNVRGTRNVCELVLDMRKVKSDTILLHLSTAYSNCDRKLIEEKLYPPHADWRWGIQIAEMLDQQTIQILTEKFMDKFPNTYTFTKSMAEHVVNDLCGHGGNTVIVRPSIVTNSYEEPLNGWVDNLNGPFGMLSAVWTGVARIIYMSSDKNINHVPVDTAIKVMILATWQQILDKRNDCVKILQPAVYNCCLLNMHMQEFFNIAKTLIWELLLDDAIWYPSFSMTVTFSWFYINFMLFQLLPAIVIDMGLSLIGKSKIRLTKIQRKIYIASKALGHFTSNEWDFKTDSTLDLENNLSTKDMEIWGYHLDSLNLEDYVVKCYVGVKKFAMKEKIRDPKSYLKKTTRMYYLDTAVKAFFIGILISFFYTENVAAKLLDFI